MHDLTLVCIDCIPVSPCMSWVMLAHHRLTLVVTASASTCSLQPCTCHAAAVSLPSLVLEIYLLTEPTLQLKLNLSSLSSVQTHICSSGSSGYPAPISAEIGVHLTPFHYLLGPVTSFSAGHPFFFIISLQCT